MAKPDFERLLDKTGVSSEGLKKISSGRSSRVYSSGSSIVKLLRKRHSGSLAAARYADILHSEQETIRDSIGDKHMAVARILTERNGREDYRVLLIQPKVDGVTVGNFMADSATVNTTLVEEYFDLALGMYAKKHKIADFACIERGFNPVVDPNTVVSTDGASVVLVDTTFGNLQRMKSFGPLIHRGIAWGVENALNTLR